MGGIIKFVHSRLSTCKPWHPVPSQSQRNVGITQVVEGKLALEGVDSLMPRYLKVMLVEIPKASIVTLADGIKFHAQDTGGVVEETAPCYRERNV
ncbi:hypothetical protein VNO77_02353 [Canavalia gladiata]|uniref:Uncharacterized protein n=1 Tax=Canavalia gladiata TaxID=3824 RepID=A0AAN9R2Z1_CANGL